jgi:RNA polymerase sigma-70 factor (ECF subfamily)
LEACRPYLLLVANEQVAPDLQAKVGGSDLVQQTFLEAQRDFGQFRGNSEADLLAWLRQILLNNALAMSRRFRGTDKRDVGREVSLSDTPQADVLNNLRDLGESPSARAMAHEQDHALRAALNRLPDDYRQVIEWYNYERVPFDEIGQRLGRSGEAARKLWSRALNQLHAILDPPDDDSFRQSE